MEENHLKKSIELNAHTVIPLLPKSKQRQHRLLYP